MATLQPGEKARMYALAGVARAGATRSAYVSGQVFIWLDGELITHRVIIDSLTIQDVLDESPNRCTFRIHGDVPEPSEEVIVTRGSKNGGPRLFAGHTLEVNQIYAANNPQQVQAEIACTDYSWQFAFVTVTARYRNQSASTIAWNLVASYAPGFTAKSIAVDLPIVDEITYTNEALDEAMTRLARRVGAYWYVDYARDVHFFITEERTGAPTTLTPAHASLAHFVSATDRSQALTRVYVEGRGSRVLANVPAGASTIPVETADMFAVAADVFLKASFQGSEGGAQHLNFTGVDLGGAGAIIGPGVTPSTGLTAAAAPGAGIESGTHAYAYSWVTATGETLVSPIVNVSHGPMSSPITAPWIESWQGPSIPHGGFGPGDTVQYAIAGSSAADGNDWVTGKSALLAGAAAVVPAWQPNPQYLMYPRVRVPWINDPKVKWLHLYRRVNGGAWWGIAGGGGPNYSGWPPGQQPPPSGIYDDDSIPHNGHAPATPDLAVNRTQLSGIAVGPSSVTSRRVYRTATNGSQLRLLVALFDNTTTTALDAASDGTLGANAPASDTAGLPQPAGQVTPGASEIVVTSTAAFHASGGWAVIGNGEQVIRYSAISGNKLIGIPASGPGAVTSAVSYSSSITAAALLTGIPASGARAINEPLLGGGEIYLVVQVDDTTRQVELAADMGSGNGVREEWVQDRRLSIGEARARGQATLAHRPLDARRITYDCRDTLTAAGKTCTVALGPPTNVNGTFKIQSVQIHKFRPHAAQLPTYSVEASSSRFSFEDWLRVMRTKD